MNASWLHRLSRIPLFLLTSLAAVALWVPLLLLFELHQVFGISALQLTGGVLLLGMVGSALLLLMSKEILKTAMGVKLIWQEPDSGVRKSGVTVRHLTGAHFRPPSLPGTDEEVWLVETVHRLAAQAGVKAPEVGVYKGEPNALSAGAFKNAALVAVSSGLLRELPREEVEAVLAHEVAHIANGDMVTMGLLQSVINLFVVLASSAAGAPLRPGQKDKGKNKTASAIVVVVLELGSGFLANTLAFWYSRQREFRADAGAARLLGSPTPLINALNRLSSLQAEGGDMHRSQRVMGVVGNFGKLFSSHPPPEARITALQALQP